MAMETIEGVGTAIGMSAFAIITVVVSALWNWFMKLNTNREVESLKSKLKNIENERSIRLSHLADKQLEVMLELYERFANLDGAIQYYCGPMDWEKLMLDSGFETLYKNICEFQTAFYRSKVFLPTKLENEFMKLINAAMRIKVTYRMVLDKENFNANTKILDKTSIDDMAFLHKEIPKIKDLVEKEYRKIWNIEAITS